MVEVGVVPGTLLVKGQWDNQGTLFFGEAKVFSRCGPPLSYKVQGGVDPYGALILTGPAPVVAPDCSVLGVSTNSPNAVLSFTVIR
jgi:hypothetical protein